MLGCWSIDYPMDVNMKLLPDQGKFLENTGRYNRLVKILNYLIMIRPDITFKVSIVNQFLLAPMTTHLEAVMRILGYLKKALGRWLLYSDLEHTRVASFSDADWARCPFDRKLTIRYYVFLERKSCVKKK